MLNRILDFGLWHLWYLCLCRTEIQTTEPEW